VYSPPTYKLKKGHYDLFFSTLGPRFTAGGDYNSKHTAWGSRITTTKGRELYNRLQNKNYSFLTTGNPTYWPTDPTTQPDLLDFFVTHGISSTYTAIEPSYDLSSDHSPVIATISTSPMYVQPTPRLHNSRNNWSNYRTKLHEEINLHISLKSCTEVEDAKNNFISLLQEAAQQATPTIAYKKYVVNIPLDIKKLLAEIRKARATWQRSHTPSDKTAFDRLSNHLKSKLQAMRANSFKHYVSTLSRYDNSIWKPIKSSRKPILASPKATVFVKHLADIFKPHAQETDDEILEFLTSPAQPVEPIKPITPKEIKEEIGLLNTKKAPGMGIITPKMLKELPQKGMILLTYLFNAILRHHYWPSKLKLAETFLLPKPSKDPKEVKSYRPISLFTHHRKATRKTDPP
jgi:hypothetical protein